MQISANQTIAGYPALEVRNFVRKHQLTPITEEAAEIILRLNHRAAADFLNKLVDIGLIEKHSEQEGTPLYALTQNGEALAQVSAAKPIRRKTAERILEQFMERVHKVSANAEYLYRVDDAILFGSMLSDVERLGDVDVAINLEPKVSDCDARREWSRRQRRVAVEAGRSLGTIVEQAYWPMQEVLLQLKARSHSLSMTQIADVKHLPDLSYRILMGDHGRIAALISNGQSL